MTFTMARLAIELALFAATTAGGDDQTVATPASFAVVVGTNKSPSPDLEPLRYADDDAIQNARMLAMLGARTTLLVSADEETRELFPDVRPQGRATHADLRTAFSRVAALARDARAGGRGVRLYVFFAGHGDTAAGRPFLELEDGRFFREDLAELVRSVGADDNHLVIDACHSTLFVGTRGPGGVREPVEPGFSRAGGPAWPARTGFLTARSAGGQTHEWTEFGAGIFSHEARSGLAGAADANLDGAITYRELAAFVARANAAIPNRKYRPQVVTTPPGGDLDAVLAILPSGPLVLELDVEPVGRTFVESERGVRLVDLNGSSGTRIKLRLPTDLGTLFVEREHPRTEYRVSPREGRLALSELAGGEPRARARGAAHESFRRLFSLPFDDGTVASFRPDASVELDLEGTPSERATGRPTWPGWALAGVAVGAAAGGTAFALSAASLSDERAAGMDRPQLNEQIADRNQAATVLFVTAGVAAVATAAYLLWRSAD